MPAYGVFIGLSLGLSLSDWELDSKIAVINNWETVTRK